MNTRYKKHLEAFKNTVVSVVSLSIYCLKYQMSKNPCELNFSMAV